MPTESRQERLAAELVAMHTLQKSSSLLEFHCDSQRRNHYLVTFHGRGVRRRAGHPFYVEFINRHDIEIRLPAVFPHDPPDIRWLTPVFHPNVFYSGLLRLPEIGLAWTRDLGLDVICERLWDVARCQYLDLVHASNSAAQAFFLRRHGYGLPFDHRPLRALNLNPRRGWRRSPNPTPRETAACGVLVIGETAPFADWPAKSRPCPLPGTRAEETLYIGDP